MKNITLAMVAVLAAVAMISAGLAVPMQQASASDGGDETGDNKVKIVQKNECEEVFIACGNGLGLDVDQNSGDDSPGMS